MDTILLPIKLAGLYGLVGMYYAAPFALIGLVLPFVFPVTYTHMLGCLWIVFGGGLLRSWLAPLEIDIASGTFWLVAMIGLLWIYYRRARVFFYKNTCGLIIAVIGSLLMHHYFDSFHAIWDVKAEVIKPHSTAISLSVWPDSTLVALLILTFAPIQRATLEQWARNLAFGLVTAVALACVLMPPALITDAIVWQPGVPDWFALWALRNFLFTCIVEETFYRLFLQRFLHEVAFRFGLPWYAALIGASLVFGLRHTGGGIPYIAFATVAGLFYGWVFHKTERLEASIIAHFTFNTLHALLFTYPFLAK
jgi:membrane protease YdiL (CAAX protease family)